MDGGVALGPAGLRYFQPERGTRRTLPLGWWVVKYSNEERIFLPGFDRAAVRSLSNEFGLPVLEEPDFGPFDDVRREYFFTSPAWDALRHWVARHPRLAKAHAARDPYLRGWYALTVDNEQRYSAVLRLIPFDSASHRPVDNQRAVLTAHAHRREGRNS